MKIKKCLHLILYFNSFNRVDFRLKTGKIGQEENEPVFLLSEHDPRVSPASKPGQ